MNFTQNPHGMVNLIRCDPAKRIDRWYSVAIEQTLFESVAVVCRYGNRRNNWQRSRIISVTSETQANTIANEIVQSKVNRGYVIIVDCQNSNS